MLGLSLLSKFTKLTITSSALQPSLRNISTTSSLSFRLTPELYGEPLKKKKRLDPAIIKAREERRKKKIEKQIRRLEKNARQLKPLDETEIPFNIIDTLKQRKRPQLVLSSEILEERELLKKDWARYKLKEYMADVQEIDRMVTAQNKALEELLKESEELYDEAITIDLALVPFRTSGPVATPPIKNYDSPDGEYIDVTKQWDN